MHSMVHYIQKNTRCTCIHSYDSTIVMYSLLSDLKTHLLFLRDDQNCRYEVLIDIFGVDYPNRDQRFEIIYNLLSIVHNMRIHVKCKLYEGELPISIGTIFSTASWFEREIFDMYGIAFSEHKDLRRILTDYGFHGNPMLKDFPITGTQEVIYNEEKRKVVYQAIDLPQDFRRFDTLSPWEGQVHNINIEEKKSDNI
ncbi:NADH-quinone oxidoreductase subunit C [Wolbachia endosymbiont of Howardula sp.]|uniref:NADH-quinone oxidoreductase subunit C n=1 Tax=Wolbachia endosymbiont of Howardula sp. TaxID=2916816 RepID=UPI00217D74C7|nr:NADH-quinone oxidoreductase subunit C [Wolbachia endosymbiont of Howardula sp.]UWI83313.1 NADH-quinone oxidoreductase subunit C [Wolbachia endosymbiont of Howardula sp.]